MVQCVSSCCRIHLFQWAILLSVSSYHYMTITQSWTASTRASSTNCSTSMSAKGCADGRDVSGLWGLPMLPHLHFWNLLHPQVGHPPSSLLAISTLVLVWVIPIPGCTGWRICWSAYGHKYLCVPAHHPLPDFRKSWWHCPCWTTTPLHHLDACFRIWTTLTISNPLRSGQFAPLLSGPLQTFRTTPSLRSVEVVHKHLIFLDETKSSGPNELHSRILKVCAYVISEPLHIIFENFWSMGEVPEGWR